jgi:hypothetical protein
VRTPVRRRLFRRAAIPDNGSWPTGTDRESLREAKHFLRYSA